MKEVLIIFLDRGIKICYRVVLALTIFLPTIVIGIFLVDLIIFTSLALMGKKWLFLTEYISKRSINALIIPKVFIFLFH